MSRLFQVKDSSRFQMVRLLRPDAANFSPHITAKAVEYAERLDFLKKSPSAIFASAVSVKLMALT